MQSNAPSPKIKGNMFGVCVCIIKDNITNFQKRYCTSDNFYKIIIYMKERSFQIQQETDGSYILIGWLFTQEHEQSYK